MQININWSPEISAKFPTLAICVGIISGVQINEENGRLRELKKAIYEEVRASFNIETLKNNPTVRAYRDFYWKLNIDPTKTRPSGEALLRRILHGDALPSISTAVDAYNLASLKTIIPISGFDKECLNPPFQVRFARNAEYFTGIGMDKPMSLTSKMLVLADEKQILCIYPYRDSDSTKVTEETEDVLIVGYNAPGISEQQLREAVEATLEYIRLGSGGEVEPAKVFNVAHA